MILSIAEVDAKLKSDNVDSARETLSELINGKTELEYEVTQTLHKVDAELKYNNFSNAQEILKELLDNKSESGYGIMQRLVEVDNELKSGDINDAQRILEEFAAKRIELGYEAILRLAKLEPPESAFQDSIYEDAIEAGKNDPRSISLILDKADRLLNNKELDEATKWWKLAIKRSKRLNETCSPRVRLGLGDAYLDKAKIRLKAGKIEQSDENLDKAVESLKRLPKRLPPEKQFDRSTRRKLNLLWASIQYYKGNNLLAEAEEMAKESEELKLAKIAEAGTEFDKAIERYESADRELPLDFNDKYRLVRAYVETDNTKKAVKVLRKQIDYINNLDPGYKQELQSELDNTYRALVDVYMIQKNYKAARTIYEKIETPGIKRETGKILASLEKLSGLIDKSR